ncbi:protein of unknown function DUF1239 [Desulfatibacillum aliphaticivorans]|uniref:LPS export ABC transporter periplasmic protein LptC n=1 Tax=Desulfatibacillum aliphaticivorans TaxID=218208 RepID=B8F9W8_DESAL|nr:protein of unknown function DUF1239 [Desulfatibacillum aliphaticivorans]
MKRRNRLQSSIIYLMAGFLIALIIGPMVGRLYMKDDGGQTTVEKTEISEDGGMVLTKLHHEAVRDGKLEWMLDAASAELTELGKSGRFYNLGIMLYGADKSETKVTAKYGEVNFFTHDFMLKHAVEATNKPYSLTSDKLEYSNEKQSLYSPGRVRIKGPSVYLTADSMQYDLKNKQAEFRGNVVAILGGS